MSVELFDDEILANEKAKESLKLFPIVFKCIIQKLINTEKYFIAGFENTELNIGLSFLDGKWFGTHSLFNDVFSCEDCPKEAIKSLKKSLLRKINEYEEELKKMKENNNKIWL